MQDSVRENRKRKLYGEYFVHRNIFYVLVSNCKGSVRVYYFQLKISKSQEMIREVTNRCSILLSCKLFPHEQIVLQFNKNEWTIFIRLPEKPIVIKPNVLCFHCGLLTWYALLRFIFSQLSNLV